MARKQALKTDEKIVRNDERLAELAKNMRRYASQYKTTYDEQITILETADVAKETTDRDDLLTDITTKLS